MFKREKKGLNMLGYEFEIIYKKKKKRKYGGKFIFKERRRHRGFNVCDFHYAI
jgi:hypothetical protein